MQRFGILMALTTAGLLGLAACDHKEPVANYDPTVDGVLPRSETPPDTTILENQKQLYEKMAAANGSKPVVASAPAATTTAPAEGTAPEGEGTTTLPAPVAPAAPAGEGVPAQPPKE